MRKIGRMALSVAAAGALLIGNGHAAEKGVKETVQKTVPKALAGNATANAAKAFEKVSAELYPKAKQEGNLIVYSVWDVEHLKVIT